MLQKDYDGEVQNARVLYEQMQRELEEVERLDGKIMEQQRTIEDNNKTIADLESKVKDKLGVRELENIQKGKNL